MSPIFIKRVHTDNIVALRRLFSNTPEKNNEYNKFKMLMVGPPGIGKGTFTQSIAKHYNAQIIDTGKIIRDTYYNNKDNYKEYDKEIIDKIGYCMKTYNSYIPDDIIIPIILKHIENIDQTQSIIFDGFPRTLSQIKLFYKQINLVIYLKGDYDLCILKQMNRISCKKCGRVFSNLLRDDLPDLRPKKPNICDDCNFEFIQRVSDKPENIQRKMDVYKQDTVPMIDYLIQNEEHMQCYNLIQHHVQNGIDDVPYLIDIINEKLTS